jgi:uncharacterized membrane protein YhaH (DUF805 family)
MAFDWKSLFSGKGRIDRTTFWTVQLLTGLFGTCLKATATLLIGGLGLLPLLPLLIASWVISALNLAKRLHDLNRSGWWMLAPLAISVLIAGLGAARFGPGSDGSAATEALALLASLGALLAIGLLKGNPGPNRFGEPPKATPSVA